MKKFLNNSLVLGLGKTGISLINFLIKNNVKNIFAWDDDFNKRNLILHEKVSFIEPENLDWQNISQVFVSPGIPISHLKPHQVIELARKNECKLTNDIELFCELFKAKNIIGITGTNGKSTVTKMISDILKDQGYNAESIGNIGNPVFDLDHSKHDFFCVEISSFQLELCKNIKLNTAILLDITPDHLDRYKDFYDYAKAKVNIFNNPETNVIISVNTDINKKISKTLKNKLIIPISTEEILDNGFSMIGNSIYQNGKQIEDIKTKFKNHNENILASYVCTHLLGLDNKKLEEAIENYIPLPHRLEIVKQHKNITIINDSKATNAESTNKALTLYKNIYWIAGGKIKKGNQLEEINLKNVKKAFFFGESKDILMTTFKNKIKCEICKDLNDAFLKSFNNAIQVKYDATILFSPAHSSFDEFQNFEKRGDYFKDLVLKKINNE